MSWPVAAYGLLALALAGGFGWYERTKPDARIVALVGTLAAFAALGRIAFAAVPNVKPTTDIVLIAGYALGGAPGFVVGAVAALTSNFFFGQGPWTPWQMAGWGATGLIGAALAPLTARRIGRIPLAVACTVVGFAFTALQDAGDWVTYSDHSLAALGVYVGQGLGFDAVHAAGCAAFALAFGPALLHSVTRFRLRLTVVWVTTALTVAALAATASAATSPVGYLLAAENPDGGFGAAPHAPTDPLFSGWAALGLEAAGVRPSSALLAYLERHPGRDPGSIERTILALAPARAPTGILTARLRGAIRRDGSVREQTNLTAFAVLALRGAGSPVPARTITWLRHQEDADGGFNFATAGAPSDLDDSGAVLEALGHTAPGRAVRFVLAGENRDGGFPSSPGGPSNAQSTAFAVEGLLAAGRHAPRALAYLRRLTATDGAVAYAAGSHQTPVWVTAQAELALAGAPLPLAPLRAARTVPAVPVASKPPARKPAVVRRRMLRRAPVRHARARELDLQVAASLAGALYAVALAPLGDV